jgi:hypothetical protein
MSSPTQRSLDLLRKEGYIAGIVEKFNHYAGPPEMKCPVCGKNKIGVRNDLFGFIDIIAVHPGKRETLAVQCTSGSNLASRRHKVLDSGEAIICMAARWKIEVHAWAKRKIVRGGKAFRYEVIREKLN